MDSAILGALMPPPSWIWIGLVVLYYVGATMAVLDGYFRELVGHKRHGGHSHDHLHRVLWQWHTGLHIDPRKSFGDERRLSRTAASATRSTPEGSIIYWTRLPRPVRALIRNGITVGALTFLWGLAFYPETVIRSVTVAVILGIAGLAFKIVRKLRAAHAEKAKMLPAPAPFVPGAKEPGLYVVGGTVTEDKPSLDGGVPKKVISLLLSDPLAISADETFNRLTLTPERGSLRLPDHFAATDKQRELVESVVKSNSSSTLRFEWATSVTPRVVSWIPTIDRLPSEVRFRDHLPALERLKPGEFGVGQTLSRSIYVADHNGDTPWHLRSAGSGTGKSTGFLVKAVQILHRDPLADLYCWDSKQVSFEHLHGIPGVTIYDDPESNMKAMWDGWYYVEQIMRDRYTAIRTGKAKASDFPDIWCLMDEGNDFYSQTKTYYDKYIRKSGMPTAPSIWSGPITSVLYLGRQVGIRGELMFQNMTDRALGGVSLRDAFITVGMAGFKKNQWTRIIGTTPAEECRNGPGKICMVTGNQKEWVQGFYDEPEYLRAYALAGRQEREAG